jgi:phi LC3 family holin
VGVKIDAQNAEKKQICCKKKKGVMNINWCIRAKNPYFWIGIIAVIFATVGLSPEMFTSWDILWEQLKKLIMNPFKLGCVIVALVGYISDPTSKGISDTERVMTFKKLQE